MEMTGESRIEAPRERVWAALNDPEVLKASIPGCEELERTDDGGFAAQVRAKVGPVSARFTGKVTLSDMDPPNGYRISGEGTGGAAGFAKGGAAVTLEPDGEATILRYAAQATVGGKLAQIGSRLIDGTARKMADDFFARFKAHVEGNGAAALGAPAAIATTPEGTADEEGLHSRPLPPPRERPADTLPAEPPAHAGPTDVPVEVGALDDSISAAHQPAMVDRAEATMHRAQEQAVESDRVRERERGEAHAPAARSGTSPWVWAGVAAVAVVILLLVFS
ncbi:MAG: SRPBCC family protein [Alphaproteobacteria bacterium]